MVTINNSINNTIGASNTGVTNTLTVTNSSNTASSQAQILTTVGGTTSGDAWNQFTVGTTRSFSIGIDNSDTNDSLKFTTDSDGTVDPSSGTFCGAVNPATASWEFGVDSNGTSSASRVINVQKNYDGSTTIGAGNTSSGSSALAGCIFSNDATFATVTVPSSAFSDANARNKLFLNCDNAGNEGIVYNAASGKSHTFYASLSGGVLLATLNATGLTIPVQPAFLAYNSVTESNATGDGTVVTVDFDTEVFDQGNDFAADTFTAPVTGTYRLETAVYISGLTNANTAIILNIVTSNRTYGGDFPHLVSFANHTVNLSVLADMDVGDTAYVTVGAYGSTKTSNVFGSGTPITTYFSGNLVC